MAQVTELGYIGFGVEDLCVWREFASQIIGFEIAEDSTEECCYLRVDNWHHRLILSSNGEDGLQFVGLRVAGPEEFVEVADQLREAGYPVEIATQHDARDRRVLELMRVRDPGGYLIEIFHGPEIESHKPFHPGRRMHGRFKTGNRGLGHFVLGYEDVPEAYRFFKTIGMRGGVEYPPDDGDYSQAPTFMHCNERDHTVAFGMGKKKKLYHLMVEYENFDDLGLTYDLMLEHKVPILQHPGKHANSLEYSIYFYTPSGWVMECGWGGRGPSHQTEYYPKDIFGHRFQQP